MPAETQQRNRRYYLQRIAIPEMNRRAAAHHPLAIAYVQIDRRVESRGPLLHRGVIVRMRNRNRAKTAECGDERLGCRIKVGDAVPENVTVGVRRRSARWLMAKAGTVLILNNCGSSCCHLLACVAVTVA